VKNAAFGPVERLIGNVVIVLAGGIVILAGLIGLAIIVVYATGVVMVRRLTGRRRSALTAGA
jgi:uncharacterized iron-regulated membrane protein